MDVHHDGEWLYAKAGKAWQGKTIAECLTLGFKIQPNKLPRLFHEHKVWIDQHPLQTNDRDVRVQAGMRIRIQLLAIEEYGVEPEYLPQVEIVWEDEHCLVANKPAGMLVHPDRVGGRGTLDAAIAFHYLQQGYTTKVRHIHRLDKDTSGLVLFAKHAEAHRILDQQLASKQVIRRYFAIVQGELKKRTGTIMQPIGRDRYNRQKRVAAKNGQPAITHFTVKETKTFSTVGKVSIVELKLETGRTHQIRVHLSDIGHPILNDTLYGGKTVFSLRSGRQALHAYRLEFAHPYQDDRIVCEIDWPEDFMRAFQLG